MKLTAARDIARRFFEQAKLGIDPRIGKRTEQEVTAYDRIEHIREEYVRRYVAKNMKPNSVEQVSRILRVDQRFSYEAECAEALDKWSEHIERLIRR